MLGFKFDIGTVIRLLREQKGLGQHQLGVHKITVSQIELGNREPKMETLRTISKHLGVTESDIYAAVDQLNSRASSDDPGSTKYLNPEHRRYHSILDQILNSDDQKCIHAVVAVLEAVAGKPSPPAQASSPVYQANNIPAGARPGDRMRARKTGS